MLRRKVLAARVAMVLLFVMIFVLYITFGLFWPAPGQQTYECAVHDGSCILGQRSPMYTGNKYKQQDQIEIQLDKAHRAQFKFTVDVVPNTHICAWFCYVGDEDTQYSDPQIQDYIPIVVLAQTQRANRAGTASLFAASVILCVLLTAASCVADSE